MKQNVEKVDSVVQESKQEVVEETVKPKKYEIRMPLTAIFQVNGTTDSDIQAKVNVVIKALATITALKWEPMGNPLVKEVK